MVYFSDRPSAPELHAHSLELDVVDASWHYYYFGEPMAARFSLA
jgi:hypothetical protein